MKEGVFFDETILNASSSFSPSSPLCLYATSSHSETTKFTVVVVVVVVVVFVVVMATGCSSQPPVICRGYKVLLKEGKNLTAEVFSI